MQIIAEIILVLAILAGIEIYREVHYFKRTDYAIVSEKLNIPEGKEKKIVFLSDLHNQQYGQNNENLVKAIRESDPDFIWIGGDMLIGKEDTDYAPALSFVKEITGICPVYCASGNHERVGKRTRKIINILMWNTKKYWRLAEYIFWKMKQCVLRSIISHFAGWRFRYPVIGVSEKVRLLWKK